jgi:ADP-ribose pyrophosphatase YjhB (NUDIX family)
MNFCNECGTAVHLLVPRGDNRERFVCTQCHRIHYQNPKLLVSCVPQFEGRILLCRRAIEPRLGFWTLPGGFMEANESLQHAAIRESQEETLARVDIGTLLSIVHIRTSSHVHVCFRARLCGPSYGPTAESSAVELVELQHIPWHLLAFRSTLYSLQRYVADLNEGHEGHHFAEFENQTP